MELATLRCPRCRSPLRRTGGGGRLACPGCGGAYPLIASTPILVPDPALYLRQSLLSLSDIRDRAASGILELERVRDDAAFAFRRPLMERAVAALRLHLEILDRQRDLLRAQTGPGALVAERLRRLRDRVASKLSPTAGTLAPPHTAYEFDNALEHLRTDWAGTPEGEAQIGAIQAAVTASIRAHLDPPSSRAIYLGAGLGRHAFDGGRLFSSVLAVELSFAAAALLAAARAGTVRFARLSWLGADREEDVVALHEAAVPPLPYAANVTYVVADALALPVADASVDAVISIFFTDVTPSSRLLPEVRRVLRPGGHFISTGPLLYHFKARAEQLTRAEMRYVLGRQGFDLEPAETTFALPCWEVPGSTQTVYRVWSFVATRR